MNLLMYKVCANYLYLCVMYGTLNLMKIYRSVNQSVEELVIEFLRLLILMPKQKVLIVINVWKYVRMAHGICVIIKILELNPTISWTHCSLHKEALVSKCLSSDLKNVLNTSIKIMNFIKSKPLQSRLFEKLCKEMGSNHKSLNFFCTQK